MNQLFPKNITGFFLTFILFLLVEGLSAQVISEINFEGNKRTKVDYLLRNIKLKVGADYSKEALEEDVQCLRNLPIIRDAEASMKSKGKKVVVTYKIKEIFPILPIVDVGGFKDQFRFSLGAVNHNSFGRAITIGGYYRYYDRSSFNFYFRVPNLKSTNWGLAGESGLNATLEPVSLGGVDYEYNE